MSKTFAYHRVQPGGETKNYRCQHIDKAHFKSGSCLDVNTIDRLFLQVDRQLDAHKPRNRREATSGNSSLPPQQ